MSSNRGWTGAFAIALAGVGLVGCGAAPAQPATSALTVSLVTKIPARGPHFSAGMLTLEGISLFGDVAPDNRSERSEIVVSTVGTQAIASFDSLPPGVYSRLRFSVDGLTLDGGFGQEGLHVDYREADEEALVDLQATTPLEILPGGGGHFDLVFDVGTCFAENELESAEHEGGEIVLDGMHNSSLTRAIGGRVAGSFSLR